MTVTDSSFDVSIIELPGGVRDADLVAAFMRFRKSVFVDQMAWPLRHIEGSEFEQYDTFDTTYIVAHRGRDVLGGARLKLGGLGVEEGEGPPGEILAVDAAGILVACAGGAVRVQTVQPETRRPQPAQVWAATAGVEVGTRFDVWSPQQR